MDCNVAPLTVPRVALIELVPTPAPVAKPPAVIVATDGVPDAHVTLPVRFCVELSLYVPVAVNCCVVPLEIVGFAGVTAMDCNVAVVTVSTVEPLTVPRVALIELVPTPAPVAKPPAVIVATEGVADAHVTEPVKFCVVLSLYVPVAVNCCVVPLEIVGFAGVTAMDCSVAAVTVSTVEPLTVPRGALIELVTTPAPVAKPPALIVATDGVADAHVTEPVRFWVELSLYVPVAVNCCFVPLEIDGLAGASAIHCSVPVLTVSTLDPLPVPRVALIELVPTPAPVAKPPEVIVATEGVADAHVTEPVRFWVELSLYVPVAVNCCVVTLAMNGLAGVTAMDCSGAAVTVSTVEPLTVPRVALIELVPVATPV